jgi:hypothetical protein
MITLGEPEVIVLGELDATSLAELGVITLPELPQTPRPPADLPVTAKRREPP